MDKKRHNLQKGIDLDNLVGVTCWVALKQHCHAFSRKLCMNDAKKCPKIMTQFIYSELENSKTFMTEPL